jgi:hypothetical protein
MYRNLNLQYLLSAGNSNGFTLNTVKNLSNAIQINTVLYNIHEGVHKSRKFNYICSSEKM